MENRTESSARSLWLWVSAGFLVLVLAWGVLFLAARLTQVETVPLARKGGAS